MIISFDDFVLDDARFELLRGAVSIELQPKAFDLLVLLIRNRERVVPKDDILDAVWANEHVTESSLTTCVNVLRRALGDSAANPRIVRAVRGRGYQFVARVQRPAAETPAPPERTTGTMADAPPRRFLLAGREAEMARLAAAIGEVTRGTGRLVLIAGEAGIGKTRLTQEAERLVRPHGWATTSGCAHESGGAPAFWPWISALRSLVWRGGDGETAPESAAATGDPLAGFLHLVGGEPATLDGAQARFRLFDAVAQCLFRVAATRPLLLVLEDLHWADRSTILLLEFLARDVSAHRILLLVTYRDTDAAPLGFFARTEATLRRLETCTRLTLRGLDPPAVRTLLEADGTPPLPDRVVELVARAAGGNPLFVNEIYAHLREERLVETLAAAPPSGDVTRVGLPAGIRELIGRRLARLPLPCLQTLRMAAIQGYTFSCDLLARTYDPPDAREGVLLDRLESATRVGVIAEAAATPGQYSFTHPLLREVLYQGLAGRRRMQLHARLARALDAQQRRRPRQERLSALAYHHGRAGEAGNPARAVDCLNEAGRHAVASLAYDEAVEHHEEALRLLAAHLPGDAARRAVTLLGLGEAHGLAGHTPRSHKILGHAAAVARSAGDTATIVQAALAVGGRHRRTFGVPDPGAVAVLEQALSMVRDGAAAMRVLLEARLALALRHDPRALDRRARLARRAIEGARALGEARVLARVLDDAVWATWSPDNLDARRRHGDELLALTTALGDREGMLRAQWCRGLAAFERGDLPAATAAMSAHHDLAETLRLPVYRWDASNYRVMLSLLRGCYSEAEATATAAFQAQIDFLPAHAEQTVLVQVGLIRMAQVRAHEIVPQVEKFVDSHPSCWKCALAWVYAEDERLEDARRLFEVFAGNAFHGVPRDPVWLGGMLHLSLACAALGDAVRAPLLYDLLAPYRDRLIVLSEYGVAFLGVVDRPLGILAAVMQDHARARDHFEAAVARLRRLDARGELAVTMRDYAEVLAASPHAADRTRAAAMTAEAAALADELGIGAIADRPRRVRRQPDGRNRPPRRRKGGGGTDARAVGE